MDFHLLKNKRHALNTKKFDGYYQLSKDRLGLLKW